MYMACGTQCSSLRTWLRETGARSVHCCRKTVTGSRRIHFLFACFFLLLCAFPLHRQSEVFASQDISDKTLGRIWDPVTFESKDLNGLFDGESINDLALYVYTPEGFRTIAFQIDLIGPDGMVIPDYVNRVRKKAVYDFIPNKDKPTTLSGRYQVLFMAKDTGKRVPWTGLPKGFVKGCEIEVQDPVDQGKGWVYLMKPENGPPPKSTVDYVNYELIKKDSQNNEQIRATHYLAGFPDPDKPFAYGYFIIPKDAGGSGVNILQSFRVRVRFNVLGMKKDLNPKDNITPLVLSYNDGPIRVTRRVHMSIVLGGLKMDWLAGDTKLETESQYYSRFFYFDGEVNLPGFVKKISKINAMFTTDFNQQADGLLWYNSVNASNGGCIVDGIMSPQEANLSPQPYLWSLMVGEQGGWGNILDMHAQSIKKNMELFYLEDMQYKDEKEPSLNGTWASTGYAINRLDKVEDKVSFRTYILAIPRDFKVANTEDLLHLVYQPLTASAPRVFK